MPFARNTDPETSHEAAETVDAVTETKQYILEALKQPRNDYDMIQTFRSMLGSPQVSDQSIRSRRAELVDSGMIEDSGERAKMPSGRWSIVWERKA
jgi:hypothetical protein